MPLIRVPAGRAHNLSIQEVAVLSSGSGCAISLRASKLYFIALRTSLRHVSARKHAHQLRRALLRHMCRHSGGDRQRWRARWCLRRCWNDREHQSTFPPSRTAYWRAKHTPPVLVRPPLRKLGEEATATLRRSTLFGLGTERSRSGGQDAKSLSLARRIHRPRTQVPHFAASARRGLMLAVPETPLLGGNTAAPSRTRDGSVKYFGSLAGTFSVAAQLPCQAVAARLRLGAEAPWPNSTSAASRRLQFGCSLIAAAGAPLFAHPRGTGRAAYMARWADATRHANSRRIDAEVLIWLENGRSS
jgi:hypothetical protein